MASADALGDDALVRALQAGDRDAFATLFERWFDRVYDVARNVVRNPDTAADVAQDTFVLAWERVGGLQQVESFGGWLLRIARNRALDRLRSDGRARPVDGDVVTGLRDGGAHDPVGPTHTPQPDEVAAAADRDSLVHAAAVALGERDMSLLDLHLRHGLSPAEIADELGVTPNNAHQLLFRLRNKLGTAIGALLLWRRGDPECPRLGEVLGRTGTEFDSATLEQVERHRRGCERCTGLRAAMVSPAQLFAATPVTAAPAVAHEQVRQGLAEAGIPVPPGPTRGADVAVDGPTSGQEPDGSGDGSADASGDGPGGASDDGSDAPSGAAAPTDPGPTSRRRRAAVATVAALLLVVPSVVWLAVRSGAARLDDGAVVATESSAGPSAAPAPAPGDPGPSGPSAVPFPAPSDPPSSSEPTGVRSGTPPSQPAGGPAPGGTEGDAGQPAPDPVTTTPPAATTTTPPAPPPPPPDPAPTSTPPRTTTTSTPPSPTPPPAAPVIGGFRVGAGSTSVLCADPRQSPRTFVWSSTGATSGVLVIGSTSRQVEPSGSLPACAGSGDVAVLTVSGPGGSDVDRLTVP